MIDLSGISIPIATPFQNDQISYPFLQNNLEAWKKYNLTSFILLGSTGEGVSLSDFEKRDFVEKAVDFIHGDKPVIIGTSFHSTSQTIDFLKFGEQNGVRGGLVLAPYYYRGLMSPSALKKFYFDVADAVEVPLIIYHFPKVTGITFSPELVLELAKHPQIIGIKDSSANITFQQAIIFEKPEDFQVLTGSASTLVPCFRAGANGAIVALANIAPQYCIDIYKFEKNGEWEKSKELQMKLIHLNTMVTGTYGVPGLKFAMEKIGLYGGAGRSPLLQVDNTIEEEINKELKKLELA